MFDRLIPLLPKEFSYLALDLPGHGLSSAYPIGMHYGSLDTLSFIENVRRFYGWEKLSIIGHSMMGGVTACYAAMFPERTTFAITLDNIRPALVTDLGEFARNIVDKLQIENKRIKDGNEPPSYEYEDLIEKIYTGSFHSVQPENCKYLLARGVKQSTKFPSRYYFQRDARVKYFFYFPCDHDVYMKLMQNLTMPFMYLVGTKSIQYMPEVRNTEIADVVRNINPDFEMFAVPGNHHFFLNNPETCYKHIEEFIYKHHSLKHKL